jgi:signal transduction histidine kinase
MRGAAAEKAATGERVMSVTTAASGGRLEISFSDTGSGMPADVLDNAFEPLFSTKAFGVGLGLPTVKQIMELHSGGVEIESVEGHGTRVVLWLPTQTVEDQE